MPFTIRPIRICEAQSFRALRLEALLAHPDSFGSSTHEAQGQTEKEFAKIASTGRIMGCFDREGGLVGMAGLASPEQQKSRHRATLWGVYVKPYVRGSGAAAEMLRATIALARPPIEEVLLTVALHNRPAIRSYERLGFEQYGIDERALKLSDGTYVDEVLMRLRL